jgi:hypothetical protein
MGDCRRIEGGIGISDRERAMPCDNQGGRWEIRGAHDDEVVDIRCIADGRIE